MHSLQTSCANASHQLSTIAAGTGVIILAYGYYSFGRILIAGIIYGGLGAVKGLVVSAPLDAHENPEKTIDDCFDCIDDCFDCIEHTSIFLIRKTVSMLREGFKNALTGMAEESASITRPWCRFYQSLTLSPKALVTQLNPVPPEQLTMQTETFPSDEDGTHSSESTETEIDPEAVETTKTNDLHDAYLRLQKTRTFGSI